MERSEFEQKFIGLKEIITKLRNKGEVIMEYESVNSKNTDEIISTFLKKLGRQPRSSKSYNWLKLEYDQAEKVLSEILFEDMAYAVEFMSNSQAKELASDFLHLFNSGQPEYFSNGYPKMSFPDEMSFSKRVAFGLTGATFDGGVVAVDKSYVGILWFGDED